MTAVPWTRMRNRRPKLGATCSNHCPRAATVVLDKPGAYRPRVTCDGCASILCGEYVPPPRPKVQAIPELLPELLHSDRERTGWGR